MTGTPRHSTSSSHTQCIACCPLHRRRQFAQSHVQTKTFSTRHPCCDHKMTTLWTGSMRMHLWLRRSHRIARLPHFQVAAPLAGHTNTYNSCIAIHKRCSVQSSFCSRLASVALMPQLARIGERLEPRIVRSWTTQCAGIHGPRHVC